ncbi:hypothetical protein VTO42DRAFT_5981 [Malbranchea cinnamomea]
MHLRFLFLLLDLFLLVFRSAAHPRPIWPGPAPPPEEGPPLSASAVRDPSLLWREIVGIVGAYVATVCIFLGCLLTVGRRLRHSAQSSNRTLEFEMFKPSAQPANGPQSKGPESKVASLTKSKTRSFSFPKPWSNSNSRGPASPVSHNGSMSTVDESVVRADRLKAEEEMERLYAAVMEHDAKQSSVVYDAKGDYNTLNSAHQPRSPIEYPEFQHLRQRQQPGSPVSPRSPITPLSPGTIPEEQIPSPSHSQYPRPMESSRKEATPSHGLRSPISEKLSRLSSLSFLNPKSSRDSNPSPNKSRRGSIRGLPISPPILSPQSDSGSPYGDSQPLSPRVYFPGPPPLNPVQKESASPVQPTSPDSAQAPTVSPQSRHPAGSSTSSLPFRVAFNSSQSPSMKTTVVEWRQSALGHGVPRTGVPRTPYSPYMPFTPVTPLTPSRIVTREERKQREKEDGRRVMTEDDAVLSGEDMWGT